MDLILILMDKFVNHLVMLAKENRIDRVNKKIPGTKSYLLHDFLFFFFSFYLQHLESIDIN